MNKEVKERWVTALRSGEYRQTKEKLRDDKGFCCLGVLCDLYSKEYWKPFLGEDRFSFLGETGVLPEIVYIWASLNNKNPSANYISIAEINDNGDSFKEIADLIEKHL